MQEVCVHVSVAVSLKFCPSEFGSIVELLLGRVIAVCLTSANSQSAQTFSCGGRTGSAAKCSANCSAKCSADFCVIRRETLWTATALCRLRKSATAYLRMMNDWRGLVLTSGWPLPQVTTRMITIASKSDTQKGEFRMFVQRLIPVSVGLIADLPPIHQWHSRLQGSHAACSQIGTLQQVHTTCPEDVSPPQT